MAADHADLVADVLRRGEVVSIVVGGGSMWPLVRAGSRVTIDPRAALRIGALAAYLRASHLVVHRVVALEAGRVVVKGDNRGRPERLDRSEILGVATQVEHAGGCVESCASVPSQVFARVVAETSRRTDLPWKLGRSGSVAVRSYLRRVARRTA